MAELFPWGDVYNRFKGRGMDHGDAAYRADCAEKRFMSDLRKGNERARTEREAEMLEAIRKLRHFAACVAADTWGEMQPRMAREVLTLTMQFEAGYGCSALETAAVPFDVSAPELCRHGDNPHGCTICNPL